MADRYITSGFTQTENLQIVAAYATSVNDTLWKIQLSLKNTGTTAATIDNIFINDVPISNFKGQNVILTNNSKQWIPDEINVTIGSGKTSQISIDSISITINPGENATISFFLNKTSTPTITFNHGQMITIKIHTASGRDYPRQLTLP